MLPIDQNTLDDCALFFKVTIECAEVINVVVALNIHVDDVTFWASKMTTPHAAIPKVP